MFHSISSVWLQEYKIPKYATSIKEPSLDFSQVLMDLKIHDKVIIYIYLEVKFL
jgi:hypothetical protein